MKQSIYKILALLFSLQVSAGAGAQVIERFAGDSVLGYSGDRAPAVLAELNQPDALAMDAAGNVYIGEGNGNVIRKVDGGDIITTFAGTAATGYTGDGLQATIATFNGVEGLAFDPSGNLVIADFGNDCIRRINIATGIISTIVGIGGAPDTTGDGGQATAAHLDRPMGVKYDASGNLYICDWGNNKIRKVNTLGIISSVAGRYAYGYTGDGFAATAAQLYAPYKMAFDPSGNLFFADGGNNCVREINMSTGIINTVVGNGTPGLSVDGSPASASMLNGPSSVAFDGTGNLYITDRGNQRVRIVNSAGIMNTAAGSGAVGEFGDGGPATAAALRSPFDILLDPNLNLYIADINGNTVRKVTALPQAVFGAPSGLCIDSCITIDGSSSTGTIDSLIWSIPGITLASPHSAIITACFLASGTYSINLTVYNISGSNVQSSSIVVNPPPNPVATPPIGETFSVPPVYTSYQWYSFANILIPGATNNTFTAPAIGTYFVVVDSGACIGQSNPVSFPEGVPAIHKNANKFWLSSTDNSMLTLYAAQPLNENLAINVYDIAGKQITADTWSAGSNTTQLYDMQMPPGLYIVKLNSPDTQIVLKWVKH